MSLKTKQLDIFIKAMKSDKKIRIGVLGDKNARASKSGETPTNAEIGAKHEFGQDGMPVRSFLRVPLIQMLPKIVRQLKLFDKETMVAIQKEKDIDPVLFRLAIVGESIVLMAFDSGGFGKWKPSNMAHKKVKQTLIESQQLRNSITWEIV